MKHPIIFSLITIACWACFIEHDKNHVKGDLYFSNALFIPQNFYNLPDTFIRKMKTQLDTINVSKLEGERKNFIELYSKFKREKLLYKPWIQVLIKHDTTRTDSVVMLFMDSIDYDRVKAFKRNDLIDAGDKITIEARFVLLGQLDGMSLLYCLNLQDIDRVKGDTFNKAESGFMSINNPFLDASAVRPEAC
jgi:hypothetical protein